MSGTSARRASALLATPTVLAIPSADVSSSFTASIVRAARLARAHLGQWPLRPDVPLRVGDSCWVLTDVIPAGSSDLTRHATSSCLICQPVTPHNGCRPQPVDNFGGRVVPCLCARDFRTWLAVTQATAGRGDLRHPRS